MRKMKNHRIAKEIIESFKERITGNKAASIVSVIIVAIVFGIVAVVLKFGEYVGTNKVFPLWVDTLFGEETQKSSDPSMSDVVETEQAVHSEFPDGTSIIPGETPTSTDITTNRKDLPTASKEEDSEQFVSEATVPSTNSPKPSEQPPPADETTKNTETKTITVSCIPIAFPLTDKNAEIRAVTSFEATKVVLACEANGFRYGAWNMKTSDSRVWTFDADFYEPNTYTLTVTAFDSNGEQVQDSIDVQYPFG